MQDVRNKHRAFLDGLPDDDQRLNALCELNVLEQSHNACETTVVQDAWARGQSVVVHGWVYGLRDGLLKNLGVTMDRPDAVIDVFRAAVKRYPRAASRPDR